MADTMMPAKTLPSDLKSCSSATKLTNSQIAMSDTNAEHIGNNRRHEEQRQLHDLRAAATDRTAAR